MKFRGHETYTIRRGWIPKGMRNVIACPDVFITKEEGRKPMDVLGIGTNMVRALRYWLKATGLTEEPKSGKRVQTLTEFGRLIYENDRYIEEIGTLWLLHYKLASNKDEASAWYYFFNEFEMVEFNRESFVNNISGWTEKPIAIRSLEDDFNCLVKTYSPERQKSSPEDNLGCPLSELNLINPIDKRTYIKRTPRPEEINYWIVLAVLFDRAQSDEIRFINLLKDPCNIGRIFNLDSMTMRDLLIRAANKTGLIKVVTTAGIDCVRIKEKLSFIDCVKKYYETLI